MKFLTVLLLSVSWATVVWSKNASWGVRQYNDQLVYREVVVRFPKYNGYWSVYVRYPPNGQDFVETITFINVVDRFRNNSGAYPLLIYGGPLHNYGTINLRNEFDEGINSTVEIYAK